MGVLTYIPATGYTDAAEVTLTRIAEFLRVLSDESRLTMLWLLSTEKELCVCDLTEALGVTQSKASRHLATLRHAGLVSDRRVGTWSYYSMRQPEGQTEGVVLSALLAGLGQVPAAKQARQKLKVSKNGRCRDVSEHDRRRNTAGTRNAIGRGM